jgi:hypothetical protein
MNYLLCGADRSGVGKAPVVVRKKATGTPPGAGLESMSNPVLVSLRMIQRLFENGSELGFFIKTLAKD